MKVAMTGASGFVAHALKQAFPDYVVIERNDSVKDIVAKLEGVDAYSILQALPLQPVGMKHIKKFYAQAALRQPVKWSKRLIKAM